jgi:hypothetical protein
MCYFQKYNQYNFIMNFIQNMPTPKQLTAQTGSNFIVFVIDYW